MRIQLVFCAVLLAAAPGGAAAQSPVIPSPGDVIVRTDPMVRAIQIGPNSRKLKW